MTLRTTHAALIPEWEFVEGEPMTAVCGATVKKAVAIDSEDGQIPSVSCGDCAPKVRQALAEKRYVVVFCRGDEIGKKQQGS